MSAQSRSRTEEAGVGHDRYSHLTGYDGGSDGGSDAGWVEISGRAAQDGGK